MKLYLAGPMSGIEHFNYPLFHQYARLLRDRGHEVFNPAEAHNGDQGLDLWKYYAADLPEVAAADAVALLPGWRHSTGAMIEALVAHKLDKPLYNAVQLAAGDDPALCEVTDTIEVVTEPTPPERRPAPHQEGDRQRMYKLDIEVVGEDEPFPEGFATDDEFTEEPTTLDVTSVQGHAPFVFYEHDPERHTSEQGGVKDNVNKPRMDLIPSAPLFEAAKVLSFGARKYKPHNWRLGLSWLETYGSLQRHLAAWLDGEDMDRESGYHHLAHAMCQILFLSEFVFRGTGTDDRFVTIDKEEAEA